MRRRAFLFTTAGAVLASLRQGWSEPETLGTIAFTQRDGLWIRRLPDGTPQKLASGAGIDSPRFSPSGDWVTFLQNDTVHVVSLDGKQSRSLDGSLCQWWPGRDVLLVSGPAGLKVLIAATGWTQQGGDIQGVSLPVLISPDDKDLVYSDELQVGVGPGGEAMRAGRLSRRSLAADSQPKVLVSNYLSGQLLCTWSRKGGYIFYWDDPDFSGSAISDGLELFRVSAAGGFSQSMGVETPVYADMVVWSPAYDKLAIVAGSGRNQWEEKRIAILDPETAAISYLTDEKTAAAAPSWSPQGGTVAFSAAPGAAAGALIGGGEPARRLLAKRRIWIADASGMSQSKPLTSNGRYRDEKPMWSADGKQILFCRIGRDNSKTLWLMGAGGENPVQVAELYADPGPLGVDDTWFGYYGYIDWGRMVDWFRGRPN